MKVGGSFRVLAVPIEQKVGGGGWGATAGQEFRKRTKT